ncbi:PREDICTED: F-box only protein 27-like [Galeopterus variegatus]|uniref:F-box only protein 27-like n=1 Tax=Galeopterus variegatus TaxID=482537 RepID=A0ABM0RLW0_GALVR|nr:PREDICTED: F-box only protein 27-like [Galeopterus variegatus]
MIRCLLEDRLGLAACVCISGHQRRRGIYEFAGTEAPRRPQPSQPRKSRTPRSDGLPRQPGPRVPQVRPVPGAPRPPGGGVQEGGPRKAWYAAAATSKPATSGQVLRPLSSEGFRGRFHNTMAPSRHQVTVALAEGLQKWMVQHGGDGWVVEENRTTVPGAPSQTCFVTSFRWCRKKQVLDLEEEGLWPELLDSGRIEICVSDWWGARHDSGCMYRLLVQLLDANQTVLDKFSAVPDTIQQWNNNTCFQVTHVFSNIKMGVRFVSFEHWGQDTQFWAGHYGARVTNSSVIMRVRPS